MIKYILLAVAVVGAVIFGANRGFHHSYLQKAHTDAILGRWSGASQVDVMREYAPLPDYDRALIEKRCTPIYEQTQRLLGTTESLPPDQSPVCQALIRGGWIPNWNFERGFAVIRGDVIR